MNSKRIILRIVQPVLKEYGYEYFENPKVQERKFCFLRKNLGNNIFAFISFQQMSYVKAIIKGEQMPHRLKIALWRNIGQRPHFGYDPIESNMENWLYLPLSQFLWTVSSLYVYDSPNYLWQYLNEAELVGQLNDVLEKLIHYGIPWLEDPKSKNPYEDEIVEGATLPEFAYSSVLKTSSLSKEQAWINGGTQMGVMIEVSGLYDCLCTLLTQVGLSWFRLSLYLMFKDLALESLSFSWVQRGANRLADPIPSISIADLQNKIILHMDEMGLSPDLYILNVVSEAKRLPEVITSQFNKSNEGFAKQTTRIGKRKFTIQIGVVPPTE